MALQKMHPLDLLTDDEIKVAATAIKKHFIKSHMVRFAQLTLQEPPKQVVHQYEEALTKNQPFTWVREAFAIVLDQYSSEKRKQKTYEVVVTLTPIDSPKVTACVYIPGVQPNLMSDEYLICEATVKSDKRVKEALARRGITDLDRVLVDLWTGFFSDPKKRIANPLLFYKPTTNTNFYSCPIDGIKVVVDMNKQVVLEVKELFEVPIPPDTPKSEWRGQRPYRQGLKPLHIVQPEGVSFQVDGRKVSWQNWSFRVGFTQWEGLVLHQIGYNDNGKERPIIYRASVAEMVVPYGDPRFPNYLKNAFDAGEDGLGRNAQSLEIGCDCLGSIYYFDATMSDVDGNPCYAPRVVCLHEEDYGILWKHKEWKSGDTEVRRSRRLVVSFFTTIANYDYGFYWYFYLDGHIELEVKLTGILSVSSLKTGQNPEGYGVILGKNLYGPIHQHFFTVRLNTSVDGTNNAVQELNVQGPDDSEFNPYKSAFYATKTTFKNEVEAQRDINPFSARYWKVINPNTTNGHGEPCGFKLVPGGNSLPFGRHDSKVVKRAGFIKHTLWVTPFATGERYPAGNYAVQKEIEDGLTKWTQANRNIYNTDIVLWYTVGVTHVVRNEDWPIMPVEYAGFALKPVGFFDYNPSVDVPPTTDSQSKIVVGCCSTKPKEEKQQESNNNNSALVPKAKL